MSTAGHCAADSEGSQDWSPGEVAWGPGEGGEVYDRNKRRIGEFAYALFVPGEGPGEPTQMDFALIRLDPGVEASPEVCHFGGPTGINSDIVPITTPVLLHYYGATFGGGHSPPLGSSDPADGHWLLPARTGLAHGLPDPQNVYFEGHAFISDSGAPLIDAQGRAVGIISGVGSVDADGHAGLQNAPRLRPALERARQYLGHKLKLVAAPTAQGSLYDVDVDFGADLNTGTGFGVDGVGGL